MPKSKLQKQSEALQRVHQDILAYENLLKELAVTRLKPMEYTEVLRRSGYLSEWRIQEYLSKARSLASNQAKAMGYDSYEQWRDAQ
jgi:hypothetical protein